MGKDKLEHFVKNTVGDYESPIDTDDLWANIQGAMPAKTLTAASAANKKNTWKWLTLGAVLLLTTTTAMWYGAQSYDSNSTAIPVEAQTPSFISAQASTEAIDIELNETLEIDNSSALNESVTTSLAKKTTLEKAIVTSRKATTKGVRSTIAPISSESAGIINTAIAIANESTVNTPNTIIIEEPLMNTETIEVNKESSVAASKIEALNTRAFVESGYMISDIDLLDNSNGLVDHSVGKPDKVICPSFGGKNNSRGSFIGELQVIPMLSTPLIVADGELGEQWKARKEATESRLESFQINAVGRYQTSFGVYVQGGIGYGQIDEKFQFNSSDITVTTDSIPVIIILRPNGMSDTIIAEGNVTTESSLVAETYNYHRMIELPFALGYEFALNRSMGIYVDFGGSVNLSTFRKGFHVVNDVDVVRFDEATQPVFKTTTGFKLNGGAGLRYYTAGGMVLSVGPELRYHTGNWIRDEHPIQLRYRDLGVRLAVGYQF